LKEDVHDSFIETQKSSKISSKKVVSILKNGEKP
jgi:hypothetical protein